MHARDGDQEGSQKPEANQGAFHMSLLQSVAIADREILNFCSRFMLYNFISRGRHEALRPLVGRHLTCPYHRCRSGLVLARGPGRCYHPRVRRSRQGL